MLQVRTSHFICRAKYEGVVLCVRQHEFDARLIDLLGSDEDLEATFPKEDVSAPDISLLKPGAIFYFHVGYVEDETGQRSRVAEVRFRRLPARQPREVAKAEEEARGIREDLGLE